MGGQLFLDELFILEEREDILDYDRISFSGRMDTIWLIELWIHSHSLQ